MSKFRVIRWVEYYYSKFNKILEVNQVINYLLKCDLHNNKVLFKIEISVKSVGWAI